jgi:putative ABC transport system ATP-binding protein
MNCLELQNMNYRYEGGADNVLKNISAAFESGKVYTIIGQSGAGKSTLLSLISGLDICTDGDVLYEGKKLRELDRDEYRAKSVGVIFQGYNLLTNFSGVYNVILSMNISGSEEADKKEFAYDLLQRVGIDRETADRTVLRLSGGEQQRVGIARALSHNPDLIIADEPTGNLDGETEENVLKIFKSLAHDDGRCVIIVTHSDNVCEIADVVYGISEGHLSVVRGR